MDLIEPLGLIESITTRLYDNMDGLLNAIGALSNNIGELEEGFGAIEAWRAAIDPKIRTLQEFDLVSYNDLRNFYNEIDDVAENTSNTRAALWNDVGGHIEALSNNLIGLKDDVSALSNALAHDYITMRDLNDHLVSTYVQKYGIGNILDLIDEATSDPYMLPNDISLRNFTVERVKGIGFYEYECVKGSLYPDGNLLQIGSPAQRWLEGHFVLVTAENLQVGDGSGTIGACCLRAIL